MSHWKQNAPLYLIVAGLTGIIIHESIQALRSDTNGLVYTKESPKHWVAPSLYLDQSLQGEERQLVAYGEDIVANTSRYFGPHGSVAPITNGMNCQNCHLTAGRQPWGNNYGAVFSTYPKVRARSGSLETIPKRVNDCFERSLNGQALDTGSREMKAIVAYMAWLGKDVPKGTVPAGTGITDLPYLERAASPEKGARVYAEKCQSCHGASGEGQPNSETNGYVYPPLWGKSSYNTGAGLYRLSRFAGYVYDNMPFNQASHHSPGLTNEEAWDVAAYVNSQPRPVKDLQGDWPDIGKKPVDHPFGPYTDGFTEDQHKYGPFGPIVTARKNKPAVIAKP